MKNKVDFLTAQISISMFHYLEMFSLSAQKRFQMRKSKNEDLGNGSHFWNNPKSTKT